MTEQQLRELFAFDAAQAPTAEGLADRARRRVSLRRRRVTSIAGATVLVVGVAGGAPAISRWLAPSPPPFAAPSAPPATTPTVTATPTFAGPTGPFEAGGLASCVEDYTLENLARRAFAFDGTAVAIGPATTDREGPPLALASVTFQVHQWFRGGQAQTVQVDMMAVPKIGTRLLVSGQPRWDGPTPLSDAIAWGCGFTRYYDPVTAARWAG